jgi:hypothetical protein
MHREITKRGTPIRANRVLALASKMFSLALKPAEGEQERRLGQRLLFPSGLR